jgi:hypothetical protein
VGAAFVHAAGLDHHNLVKSLHASQAVRDHAQARTVGHTRPVRVVQERRFGLGVKVRCRLVQDQQAPGRKQPARWPPDSSAPS